MCNEDGRIALVVNGEIYNFLQLRKGLVASLECESGNVDRIWTLLMLELWFREFIDAPRTTPRPLPAP